MRASEIRYRAISLAVFLISLVIVLLPFHAFLTVWLASNFGHYTLLRLCKEFVILLVGIIAIIILATDTKIRDVVLKNKLIWLIVLYVVVDSLVSFYGFSIKKDISTKALAYGLLDDFRFLMFFVICFIFAHKTDRLSKRWLKLIIWPAIIVVVFGVLQFSVLPANFLAHFGYGPKTIRPFQTINNNIHFVRILSTLRGSDPLGAYLILPISALFILIIRHPKSWIWLKSILLILSTIVLYASYSRAAWIGAVLALLFILAMNYFKDIKKLILKTNKYLVMAGVLIVIVGLSLSFIKLEHSRTFQNIVFHYQKNSSSPLSSDAEHLLALKEGFNNLVKHPLGSGSGTSGPASVYNHKLGPNITENYFLQVGEESGWLGMGLFIAINIYLGILLYKNRRSDFALTMLASLIGLSFVCLLTLEWTDDTMTYIWWGLAGVAISLSPAAQRLKLKKLKI